MKSSFAALFALVALAAAAPAKRQCSAPVPTSTVAPPPPASSTLVPGGGGELTSTDPVPPVSTTAPPPPPPTTTAPPPPPVTSTEPAPPASTSSAPPPPAAGGAVFSVYADIGIDAAAWPSAADLGDWNDLLLAFWLSDGRGAFDTSAVWAGLDDATKKSVIDDYHAAGKTIRVSAFGATDAPLSHAGDPVAIGTALAAFVTANQLDGVDLDYEDSASFNAAGDGENFLIALTKTLRAALPSPQYTISHAPQSPYFTSAGWYPMGAYNKVHAEVGDLIDFYNIQYYNQGQGMYEDCASLFSGGATTIAGTSVGEIIAAGVPAAKVVIGKPGAAGDASNGIMAPDVLGGCISAATTKPGGVMAWQWATAKADWIAAAKGDL